ncbi:MAG: TraR/DksA family transcriptional regulator [Candidatus Binataceae bacterium]
MTKQAVAMRRKQVLAEACERLKRMKAKLIGEIESTLRAEREGDRDVCLDSSDLASEESDRELSTILSARYRIKIEQIENALERISDASYGLCDSCGFEIAEARFSAVPFTRRCCDCQQEQERDARTRQRYEQTEDQITTLGSTSENDGDEQSLTGRPGNESNASRRAAVTVAI